MCLIKVKVLLFLQYRKGWHVTFLDPLSYVQHIATHAIVQEDGVTAATYAVVDKGAFLENKSKYSICIQCVLPYGL